MSKLQLILSRLIFDNAFRNSFLENAALAAKEYNLSESELGQLLTIDIADTQEIEERVSKSFLAIEASFTAGIGGTGYSGSGTGSGTGSGVSGGSGW